MKNVLDERWRTALQARMDKLTPDAQRRWGKMTVGQMVCHVTDPLRIALGEMEAEDISTLMTRSFLRWAVLAGLPPPKGKIATFPELDQAAGGGTPPTDLAADVATYEAILDRFCAHDQQGKRFQRNPAFGALSNRSWGRLTYCHVHHHLKQFGV